MNIATENERRFRLYLSGSCRVRPLSGRTAVCTSPDRRRFAKCEIVLIGLPGATLGPGQKGAKSVAEKLVFTFKTFPYPLIFVMLSPRRCTWAAVPAGGFWR